MNRHHWIAAAALMWVGAAQAQVSLSTPELTLTTTLDSDFLNTGPQQFSLLSSGDGVTRIGMTSLATLMNVSAIGGQAVGDQYHADFNTFVNTGYRVTDYRLDGTIVGLRVAPPLPVGPHILQEPSIAQSLAVVRLYGAPAFSATPFDSSATGASSLSGELPVSLTSAPGLNLTGNFILGVFATVFAFVGDGYYLPATGGEGVILPAFASVRFTNPVLTVYTQPVPEPTTFWLLGAGMAVLAAGVRRRNRLQR